MSYTKTEGFTSYINTFNGFGSTLWKSHTWPGDIVTISFIYTIRHIGKKNMSCYISCHDKNGIGHFEIRVVITYINYYKMCIISVYQRRNDQHHIDIIFTLYQINQCVAFGFIFRTNTHCWLTNSLYCYFLYAIYIIPPDWNDMCNWNTFSYKTRNYLFYIINNMVTDVPTMQGSSSSAPIICTMGLLPDT